MQNEERPYRQCSEAELFELIQNWEDWKRKKEQDKRQFEQANMNPGPQGYDWIWDSPEYLGFEEIIRNMANNIRAAREELAARREDPR